jgi:ketosteroid isomerase-like protein
MSNVDRLRKMHEQFSAGDFEPVLEQASEQLVLTDHGRAQVHNGRAGFREWLEAFKAISSDMAITDAQYIEGGDYVTAMFRAVGRQDGPMEPFPASGRNYSLDVCEVWRFGPDGLAVEAHNYSDGLGLLVQLGHVEAPPAPG